MSITITWAAKVINVPQSYLTPVSSGLYELDVNAFRLVLKDLEDSEEGIAFPTTHSHNTTVTVGGVTLARVVEIINGYTITFENGTYAVRLAGANNNIADVMNINSVSLRSNNSAGLVQVDTGGGGATDWTAGERAQIRHRLGIDGSSAEPVATPSLARPGDSMSLTPAERTAMKSVLLAHALTAGATIEQALRRIAGILGGLTSGAGTSTEAFYPMGTPATGTPEAAFGVSEVGERTSVVWGS